MPSNPYVFPQPMVERHGMITASCDYGDYGGMDLRDYFAAHAMGVMIGTLEKFDLDTARAAYACADAMLAARDKGGA